MVFETYACIFLNVCSVWTDFNLYV